MRAGATSLSSELQLPSVEVAGEGGGRVSLLMLAAVFQAGASAGATGGRELAQPMRTVLLLLSARTRVGRQHGASIPADATHRVPRLTSARRSARIERPSSHAARRHVVGIEFE